MTEHDQAYFDRLAANVVSKIVEALEPPRDDRPLLTVREAGERLGISEKSTRDLVNHKGGRPPRLASVIVGDGARRIEQSEIDRYIAERRQLASRSVPREDRAGTEA